MASDGRNPPYIIHRRPSYYLHSSSHSHSRTIRTVVCALLQSCWQRPLESLVPCSDVLEHPSPHSSGQWLKPMLAPLSSFLPGSHFTLSRGSSGPLRHRGRGVHTQGDVLISILPLICEAHAATSQMLSRDCVLRTFLFRSFVSIFLICLY